MNGREGGMEGGREGGGKGERGWTAPMWKTYIHCRSMASHHHAVNREQHTDEWGREGG